VLGGAVAIVAYTSMTGRAALPLLDSAALGLPLGEAIARLGCLVYGCCWGSKTNSRFGICYTSPDAKVNRHARHLAGERLHPAQLYASLLHTALFVAFLVLLPHKPFDGAIAVLYLIAHPVLRVTLERFRSDDRGKLLGPLTHTNLYSAVQIAFGVVLLAALAGHRAPMALDLGTHLGDVYVHWAASMTLVGISLAVATAFGLHYREVGAWVPHDHGQEAAISLQHLEGARSWRS